MASGFGDEENTAGKMERPIAVAAHTTMLSLAADDTASSWRDTATTVPILLCGYGRRLCIRRRRSTRFFYLTTPFESLRLTINRSCSALCKASSSTRPSRTPKETTFTNDGKNISGSICRSEFALQQCFTGAVGRIYHLVPCSGVSALQIPPSPNGYPLYRRWRLQRTPNTRNNSARMGS